MQVRARPLVGTAPALVQELAGIDAPVGKPTANVTGRNALGQNNVDPVAAQMLGIARAGRTGADKRILFGLRAHRGSHAQTGERCL